MELVVEQQMRERRLDFIMEQQIRFIEEAPYPDDYDVSETLDMEFVKVEHLDELLSEDSLGTHYGEENAEYEKVQETDPLAPDPLVENAAAEEKAEMSIKKEPADEVEQGTNVAEENEKTSLFSENGTGTSSVMQDGIASQNKGRITRSRTKQDLGSEPPKTGKETQGRAATARKGVFCPVCLRRFATRKVLEQHLNSHTGERPFECHICGVKYAWATNLKRHRQKMHKTLKGGEKQAVTTSETANTTTGTLLGAASTAMVYEGTRMSQQAAAVSLTATPRTVSTRILEGELLQNAVRSSPTENCGASRQQVVVKHEYGSQESKQMIIHHLRRHTSRTPHPCNICGQIFPSRWYLDRHVTSTHAGERPFRCPICAKSFSWDRNLRKHMDVHRSETGLLSVEELTSDRTPASKSLDRNTETTSICTKDPNAKQSIDASRGKIVFDQVTYSDAKLQLSATKCSMCPKKFTLLKNLRKHMAIHVGVKPTSCPICGKTFTRRAYLQVHMSRVHAKYSHLRTIKRTKQNLPLEKNTSRREMLPESFELKETTAKQIPTEKNLQKVIKTANGDSFKQSATKEYQCEQRDTMMESMFPQLTADGDSHEVEGTTTNDAVKESSSQKYQCIMCPRSTNSKAAMLAHMQKHMGGSQTRCSICGLKMSGPAQLERHMLIHTGEKLFQCPICFKEFRRKDYVQNHLKLHVRTNTHSNALAAKHVLACVYCGKSFDNEHILQEHLLQCPRKSVVINQRKHSVSGENEDKMIPSSQSTPNVQRRRKNVRSQCYVCKKIFCNKWYMRQHLRIHTGDPPFLCKICTKPFAIQTNFRNHMKRYHTKKKELSKEKAASGTEILKRKEITTTETSEQQESQTHKCSVCKEILTTQTALLSHMLRHQGEKSTQCIVCDKVVATPRGLKRHMFIHTSEPQYQCLVCGEKFFLKKKLEKHSKKHTGKKHLGIDEQQNNSPSENTIHEEEIILERIQEKETTPNDNSQQSSTKKNKIANSEKMLTNRAALRHCSKIDSKRFQCSLCNRIIFTKWNLIQHMRKHKIKKSFQCTVCDASFFKAVHLKTHMKSHMQVTLTEPDKSKTHEVSEINPKSGTRGKCQKLKGTASFDFELKEKMTPSVENLQIHKLSQPSSVMASGNQVDPMFSTSNCFRNLDYNNTNNIPDQGAMFYKNVMQNVGPRHSNRHMEHQLQLLQVNTALRGQDSKAENTSLLGVEMVKSGASKNQSSERYSRKNVEDKVQGYNVHSDINTMNRCEKCELCGKVFTQYQDLLEHVKKRSCLLRFECNVCGKKYQYQCRLNKHMLVHKEELPKECDTNKEPEPSLQEPEVIILDSRSPSPVEMVHEPETRGEYTSGNNGKMKCDAELGDGVFQSMIVNENQETRGIESMMNLISEKQYSVAERATGLPRASLQSWSMLPPITSESPPDMAVIPAETPVDQGVDIATVMNARLPVPGSLVHRYLQRIQVRPLTRPQMRTWKENAVVVQPDRRIEMGNSLRNPPPYTQQSSSWYRTPPPDYSTSADYLEWLPQTNSFQTVPSSFMTDRSPPPAYPGNNMYSSYTPAPRAYSEAQLARLAPSSRSVQAAVNNWNVYYDSSQVEYVQPPSAMNHQQPNLQNERR